MKPSTWSRSVWDWRDRSLAAATIWLDTFSVSAAAWLTPAMLDVTSLVPAAAWDTLRAISIVAAPCWSTAVAMPIEIPLTCSMIAVIEFDRGDDFRRRGLHVIDLSRYFFGRLRGLSGEALHLDRDDRKTPSGLAGTRRLDRRIERQKVGLGRDVIDEADNLADPLRFAGKAADDPRRCLGLAGGLVGNIRRRRNALPDLAYGRRQLLGRTGHRLDIRGGLFGRRGDDRGLTAGFIGHGTHLCRVLLKLQRCAGYGAHDAHDVVLELVGERVHQGALLGFRALFGLRLGPLQLFGFFQRGCDLSDDVPDIADLVASALWPES